MDHFLQVTKHAGSAPYTGERAPYTKVTLFYQHHCVAVQGPNLEAALQQLSFDLLNMATLVTRQLHEEKDNADRAPL